LTPGRVACGHDNFPNPRTALTRVVHKISRDGARDLLWLSRGRSYRRAAIPWQGDAQLAQSQRPTGQDSWICQALWSPPRIPAGQTV